MNKEWIKCEEELPPCDGIYLISDIPSMGWEGVARYDGYGFLLNKRYLHPKYWTHLENIKKIYGKKIYGKIKKERESLFYYKPEEFITCVTLRF